MRRIIFSSLFVCSILFAHLSKADHIAGADLSYKCLGNNQYQINLNIYADCLGHDPVNNAISPQQTIYLSSTCSGTTSMTVNLINAGGTEISSLCPSQINNSNCNGGSLPGMLGFYFTDTITLIPCNTWVLNYSKCCRNAAIINLQSPQSYGIHVEAILNSATVVCNSSPVFTAAPVPYVCVTQSLNYNFGVTETDGDSLHYSLVNATAAGSTNLVYASGYSASLPISGILLDPASGQLSFTSTTIGSFVVVVLVREYDSNGNLIGKVMRDIQFVVLSCTNSTPDPTSGIISKLSGGITQTGSYSLEVCENSFFTFTTTYLDADAGDVLTLLSNITNQLPGSVLTSSGSNPLIANIRWTPPEGSMNTNFNFFVKVNDGSCPAAAEQLYYYDLTILPRCSMLFIPIPNVFTPGGTNPVFLIRSYGLINYSIQIFDRWGAKVFESADVNSHWDGNNVSDGTYFYMIQAKGLDQVNYSEKGFVQRIGVH